MRDLSHHELRSLSALCSGGALLVAIAVFFSAGVTAVSPQAVTAATLLGTSQGINPAPSACNTDQTASGLCNNPTSRTLIFSIHSTDSVQTFPNPGCKGIAKILGQCSSTTSTASGQTLTEQCGAGSAICSTGASAGSGVTVANGKSVTVEFDELVMQNVGYPNGCNFFCGDAHDHYDTTFLSSCTTNYGETPNTLASYDGGHHKQSSMTFTPTDSTTYTITCTNTANPKGPAGPAKPFTLSIPVTVVAHVNPPTVTINGNGTNPVSVKPGQKVTIDGTYTASPGDTLTNTALNDSNNVALKGVAWTPPINKQFKFSTTTPGTYTFYPAVTSMTYPAWDNYGASLVVDVSCPAGQSVVNGKCVVAVCPGQHQANFPACNTCDVGYVKQGAQCVPGVCPGVHQINYPTCSCDVGYMMQGGVCVVQPASISTPLKANPTRVVKGQQTSLSWSTTGMGPGACTLRDSAGHVLSQAASSSGLPVTVGAQTTYTLTCFTAGPTLTSGVTVTVVPSFIEI